MPHTILTIEDDTLIRDTLVDWLENNGFSALKARSGREGIDVFNQKHPDLVLLDLTMPEINGLTVLKTIRLQDPDVPVIIVSGRNDIKAAISAFKAGAWDYVTKPIASMDIFKATILNGLEKKDLKEKVKHAEERYSTLIQNLPIIVFALKKNFHIDFINRTCEEILGYSDIQLIENKGLFFKRIPKENRKEFFMSLRSWFTQSNTPFSLEFKFKHKRGYLMHLQARFIGLSNPKSSENPERVEGVIMDVTEHHFLEEVLVQREKLNLLGAMSSEMAHQFRNPLMSLGGFARILQHKHPLIKETEIILSEAKKLESILEGINEYIKPVPITPKECSVNDLLSFSLDMLKELLNRQGVKYTLNLTDPLSVIKSDENLIQQVFISLITQVASLAHNTRITFSSYETSQHVCIELDIAPKIIKIEQPGFTLMPFECRQDSTMAGTYRMVKNIGGYLSLRQEENTTSFTLSLPKIYLLGLQELEENI
ncbi:MAG: response regulator [Desulfoplanes sp.]|nr:response regulator [Desulfoplanes sp.]MDD4650460.1 response regulator [Desulfoplanes sp.]